MSNPWLPIKTFHSLLNVLSYIIADLELLIWEFIKSLNDLGMASFMRVKWHSFIYLQSLEKFPDLKRAIVQSSSLMSHEEPWDQGQFHMIVSPRVPISSPLTTMVYLAVFDLFRRILAHFFRPPNVVTWIQWQLHSTSYRFVKWQKRHTLTNVSVMAQSRLKHGS